MCACVSFMSHPLFYLVSFKLHCTHSSISTRALPCLTWLLYYLLLQWCCFGFSISKSFQLIWPNKHTLKISYHFNGYEPNPVLLAIRVGYAILRTCHELGSMFMVMSCKSENKQTAQRKLGSMENLMEMVLLRQ